jgi:hypothetical protein
MNSSSRDTSLNVDEVLREFKKAEASPNHRKDAFKIEGSFEDAVKRIAKAKPTSKPPSPRQ